MGSGVGRATEVIQEGMEGSILRNWSVLNAINCGQCP